MHSKRTKNHKKDKPGGSTLVSYLLSLHNLALLLPPIVPSYILARALRGRIRARRGAAGESRRRFCERATASDAAGRVERRRDGERPEGEQQATHARHVDTHCSDRQRRSCRANRACSTRAAAEPRAAEVGLPNRQCRRRRRRRTSSRGTRRRRGAGCTSATTTAPSRSSSSIR